MLKKSETPSNDSKFYASMCFKKTLILIFLNSLMVKKETM